MVSILRTDSNHPGFVALVQLLDAELRELDGDDHAFYAQLNTIDQIKHAVVAFDGVQAVGCGAIREYAEGVMEVKRMYVLPERRGAGIALLVLRELEAWGLELQVKDLILETGMRQPAAIALYEKAGYAVIPNYGKYAAVENSICFKKMM